MSGAYSLMNVLADVLGPGTVGLHGEPQVTIFYSLVFNLYLVTLCMIILLLIQMSFVFFIKTLMIFFELVE